MKPQNLLNSSEKVCRILMLFRLKEEEVYLLVLLPSWKWAWEIGVVLFVFALSTFAYHLVILASVLLFLNGVSGPTTAAITEQNMGSRILNMKLFNELMCCATTTFRRYLRLKNWISNYTDCWRSLKENNANFRGRALPNAFGAVSVLVSSWKHLTVFTLEAFFTCWPLHLASSSSPI